MICESALAMLNAASAFSHKRGENGIEETKAGLKEGEAESGVASPSRQGTSTLPASLLEDSYVTMTHSLCPFCQMPTKNQQKRPSLTKSGQTSVFNSEHPWMRGDQEKAHFAHHPGLGPSPTPPRPTAPGHSFLLQFPWNGKGHLSPLEGEMFFTVPIFLPL